MFSEIKWIFITLYKTTLYDNICLYGCKTGSLVLIW